jgi:hypothetical protein
VILLSIDPSSTAIGFALMTSAAPGKGLGEYGAIWPEDNSLPALQRLPGMLSELAALLVDLNPRPTHVIVEVPGFHQRKRSGTHAGAGALMLYGFAAGVVWQLCRGMFASGSISGAVGATVEMVESSAWSTSDKTARQMGVEVDYPDYRRWRAQQRAKNKKSDAGGDISDAIAMGRWWFERQTLGAKT